MASITEIKNRLPQKFVEELYEMFSPGIVDNVFRGIAEKRFTTLRVNTLKYNIQDLMRYFKEINIKFERVLWYNDALIIKNANGKDLQKLDIYKEGKIYLQSLPSMIPPLVLSPKTGEKVLDLTAAPGGKTTEMAALMNGKGYIFNSSQAAEGDTKILRTQNIHSVYLLVLTVQREGFPEDPQCSLPAFRLNRAQQHHNDQGQAVEQHPVVVKAAQ